MEKPWPKILIVTVLIILAGVSYSDGLTKRGYEPSHTSWVIDDVLQSKRVLPEQTYMTQHLSEDTDTTNIDRREKIIKKWVYRKVYLKNGKSMDGQKLGFPTMTFKSDSTYTFSFGEKTEKGEWQLHGDTLRTITNNNGQKENLHIKELKRKKFIVEGKTTHGQMTIVMIPFQSRE